MVQGRVDAARVAGVAAARAAIAARRRADFELHTAVAALAADGAAATAGYRSLPSLLQDTLRINQTEATRLVDRAGRLAARASMTGQPLEPELPATAAACAAGVAGEGHVTVIVETLEHLRQVPGLDAEVLAAAEAALAEHAGRLAPAGLRRVALRLVDELDPDGAAPEEESEPVDELHRVRRRDGSIAIKARIHGLVDAELLDEVFDALGVPAGADDRRTRPQRDAEVLKELCAQAASPTGIATDTRDHPATPAGQAADEPEADEPEVDAGAEGAADTDDAPTSSGGRCPGSPSAGGRCWRSPSTTAGCSSRSGTGASTPSAPSTRPPPAAWPATPASSPPSSGRGANPSTSDDSPTPSPKACAARCTCATAAAASRVAPDAHAAATPTTCGTGSTAATPNSAT